MSHVFLNFMTAILTVFVIGGVSALVVGFSSDVFDLEGKQLGGALGLFWGVIVGITIGLSLLPQCPPPRNWRRRIVGSKPSR